MKQGKAANQLQPGYEPMSLKTLVCIVKLKKNKQQLLQPRQGSQASSQAAVSSNSLWTKYNNHNLILKSALHHLLCFLHVWVSFFLHWATSVGIPPFRGGGVSQGMCTTLGVCMLAWSFPCQGGASSTLGEIAWQIVLCCVALCFESFIKPRFFIRLSEVHCFQNKKNKAF